MEGRPHETMSMDELMQTWPDTIRIVLDHGLLCVGCPFARFQTLEDAIRDHKIDGAKLRGDIRAVVEGKRAI